MSWALSVAPVRRFNRFSPTKAISIEEGGAPINKIGTADENPHRAPTVAGTRTAASAGGASVEGILPPARNLEVPSVDGLCYVHVLRKDGSFIEKRRVVNLNSTVNASASQVAPCSRPSAELASPSLTSAVHPAAPIKVGVRPPPPGFPVPLYTKAATDPACFPIDGALHTQNAGKEAVSAAATPAVPINMGVRPPPPGFPVPVQANTATVTACPNVNGLLPANISTPASQGAAWADPNPYTAAAAFTVCKGVYVLREGELMRVAAKVPSQDKGSTAEPSCIATIPTPAVDRIDVFSSVQPSLPSAGCTSRRCTPPTDQADTVTHRGTAPAVQRPEAPLASTSSRKGGLLHALFKSKCNPSAMAVEGRAAAAPRGMLNGKYQLGPDGLPVLMDDATKLRAQAASLAERLELAQDKIKQMEQDLSNLREARDRELQLSTLVDEIVEVVAEDVEEAAKMRGRRYSFQPLRYTLLGSGSCGDVLKHNGRGTAVKLIRTCEIWDPNQVVTEVVCGMTSDHPNVNKTLDVWHDRLEHILAASNRADEMRSICGDCLVVEMQLANRGDLLSLIKDHDYHCGQGGRLTELEVLELLDGAAQGLAHLHHMGYVHNDLKSDNIVVATGPEGRDVARVCDFGFAFKAGTKPWTPQAHRSNDRYYCAWEAVEGLAVPASDVSAFGIVIGQMLIGAGVYQRRLPGGQDGERLDGQPANLLMEEYMQDLDHVSAATQAIVRACTNDRPEDRCTAADLAKMLQAAAEHIRGTTAEHSRRGRRQGRQSMRPDNDGSQLVQQYTR